jgi:hypothetical protein
MNIGAPVAARGLAHLPHTAGRAWLIALRSHLRGEAAVQTSNIQRRCRRAPELLRHVNKGSGMDAAPDASTSRVTSRESVVLRSRREERDGRPMIVELNEAE